MTKIIPYLLFCLVAVCAHAQRIETCRAVLKNDTLVIENELIARRYSWNNGNLITRSLTDKKNEKEWKMTGNKPDLSLPGQTDKAQQATFSANVIPQTVVAYEHLEIVIIYMLDNVEVKRVFRVYPTVAAIACDLYFRGESTKLWSQTGTNMADMVNLEKLTGANAGDNAPVIEKIDLPGRHWQLKAVEFFDITDRFNTLVHSVEALSYRPNLYRGNLLFAHDPLSNSGLFILKEAPTSNVQLAYAWGDFLTEYGNLNVIGAGITPADLHPTEWRRAYGFVTGLYAGEPKNAHRALREYQRNLRILNPKRDEMILMNTWGDRGQDTRVNEKFALAELIAGAKLGITHFQLDDGWQLGRSSNSAFKGGTLSNIWETKNYWKPNPDRFPNGLEPVVKKGKELGIELCLWFNPSRDNSNKNWEKDANTLIELYKNQGIRTFKIDGVNLPDKLAEMNFRKFLDRVSLETDYNVVFNLDVTAQRRGGYHYLNTYGNLFLENRYTDWSNYYPYTTLRNLWMLSEYVPAQNLQIEFLNKWRNVDKYAPNDAFAPQNYSFDYLFAITMVAQPLAWFEGSSLPVEAFATGKLIETYNQYKAKIHAGQIFPIGDIPSGQHWTGFQSILSDKEGFVLIFREDNADPQKAVSTWLSARTRVTFTPIAGDGKAFESRVLDGGKVLFTLPAKNSFGLYIYSIN
jgi:alpha-galactosidase